MVTQLIFLPIDRFVWALIISILFACSFIFINRSRENEHPSERKILIGFCCFFIGVAISRIFLYISVFFLEGSYINHSFFGNFNQGSLLYVQFTNFGHISWLIGMLGFYILFEIGMKKTYFIFTLINLIFLVIVIIFIDLFWIISGLNILFLFFLFAKYSSTAEIETQNMSSFAFIGLLLCWMGYVIEMILVRDFNLFSNLYPMLLYLMGASITLSKIKIIEPLYVISIFLVLPMLFALFNYQIPIYILIGLVLVISLFYSMVIYSFTRIIKYLKAQDILETLSDTINEKKDLLTLITNIKNIERVAELQHLFLMQKSGITIYSESLSGLSGQHQKAMNSLLGSVLTAIEMVLKEISESENSLKEVKQQNFSILIEEGKYTNLALIVDKDQKVYRKKMKKFLEEFEGGYEELLKENVIDTNSFESIKGLINNIFK